MTVKIKAFTFAATALIASGCSTLDPAAGVAPATVEDVCPAGQPALPGQPSFSAAMDLYAPLGRVDGADDVAPTVETRTNDDLSAAAAYADCMDSYAFIVWRGGDIVHQEYFDPYDAQLRADSASMHKTVLALLIGAAIDDGFIGGVGDPVSAFIPEWAGTERGDVSIENLLQMSSGLEPLSFVGGLDSELMKFNSGHQVRETILNRDLAQTPGEIFHYSGVSSQLLGLILERATGQKYADYLSTRLWRSLGAQDAFVWYTEPDGFPRTHTALLATPQDWLRIGLLIKDRGQVGTKQIVSEDFVQSMTKPSPANPNYGYQIWLDGEYQDVRYYNEDKIGMSVAASEPFAVDDMIYLDGFGGQRVYISRSLDLVIVRTGDVRMDWDDTKLPNLVIQAVK